MFELTEYRYHRPADEAMPVQVRLKRSIPVPRVIFYGLIAALVLLCVLCIALPLLIHLLKPRCAKTDDTSIVEPPIRLSSSLIPEKYFLSIKLFLPSSAVNYDRNMDFTFSGNVTIHFQCVQETSEIALHVDRLRIAESSFHLVERSVQAKQIKLDKMQTFVAVEQTVFRLAKPLKPGAYALHLSYSGILSESLEGFYRSSYVENNEKKWLAVTQFQPTHARRALPCFDEPHLKAEFAITVTAPSNMKALSNAIEESERLIGGGWKTTRYKLSPKMSTYLVAIVVCEFEHTAAKTKRGTLASFRKCQSHVNFVLIVPHMVSTVHGRSRRVRRASRPQNSRLLRDLFRHTVSTGKTRYLFDIQKCNQLSPFFDMVAIPDFDAGAMENWGLITYREMLLLYTPLASTAKVRQTIAEVVAHELAHQWFGNLVTMRWWDDLWLNEGFASYMQYAGADHAADGAFHLMEQFPIRSLQQAMEPDELESSHALQVPEAQSPADIFTIFDQITYDKGASMVRMMQYLIGEEVLRKGLMQYLKSNVYDVTTMHNLWEILFTLNEEQPTANVTLGWDKKPVNIEQLMYCWITGPGFPLVTIDRNYDNATATISQKRFYITDKATSRSTGECAGQWYVPLWQRNKTATWGPSWLEPNSVLLLELNGTGSDDWLIVNPKARAYFRTLYDDRNWDLITEQLLKDHTVYDVETRSQLIDDAFALARAGELHYSKALALSQYLRMETHFVPWETGIKVLNHLGKMYDEHEMYGTFKQYFLELIVPLFERTSNDAKLRADDILQERLRSTSWRFACHLDHAGCVDRARALYGQYMQECSGPAQRSGSECNPVPTDLRETVYCAGVAEGGAAEWNFLWSKFRAESVAAERWSLIAGLACTRDKTTLFNLFNHTVDGIELRSSEAGLVFQNAAPHGPLGRQVVYEYVTTHWKQLSKRFGDSPTSLKMLASAATSDFKTKAQLSMMRNFMRENAATLGPSASDFERQLEQTALNVAWIAKYEKSVITWITDHLSVNKS